MSLPAAVLKQARESGQLNLSSRNLTTVPKEVWTILLPPSTSSKTVNLSFDNTDRWWDCAPLTKLLLVSNTLEEIPADIAQLNTLAVLDAHDNRIVRIAPEIAALTELKTLHLGHNRLAALPKELTQLRALRILRLDNNALAALPEDLHALDQLEELDVSFNKIAALPGTIGRLVHLRKVILSNNKIAALPPSFGQLREITELDLTHNALSSLPEEIQRLDNLVRIDLRYNALALPPNLSKARGLREIYLGFNRIASLEGCRVFPLDVQILDVRDNKVEELPEEIALLTRLERLDVSNNSLAALPAGLGALANMKAIVLDGNPLRTIRRDIIAKGTQAILKHLRNKMDVAPVEKQVKEEEKKEAVKAASQDAKQLQVLDCSGKGYDIVPQDIWNAASQSRVSKLLLSKNKLRDLPADVDVFAESLTVLDMSYNKLERLSASVIFLKHLVTLDVRGNALSGLPEELAGLHMLQDVVLSLNRFKELPAVLFAIPSLTTIIANDNQISAIPVAGLLQLPTLVCLDLTNNSIATVPAELGLVESLKSLKLEGNVFKIPRPDVLAKGTPAVLAYLKDRVPK